MITEKSKLYNKVFGAIAMISPTMLLLIFAISIKNNQNTDSVSVTNIPSQNWTPIPEKAFKNIDLPDSAIFTCPSDTVSVYGKYHADGEVKRFEICIDKYEYPGVGHIPTQKTFEDAKNACEGRGGHLCSQVNWERACRGNSDDVNGISESSILSVCNLTPEIRKAGEIPACRNIHGVVDIIGNAPEWQSEGTVGYDSCEFSYRTMGDKNAFRCCYDIEK